MLRNSPESNYKVAYSVEELADATSLSKAYLRNAIRSGNLRSKKIGRRVVILQEFIDEWFDRFAGAGKPSEVVGGGPKG